METKDNYLLITMFSYEFEAYIVFLEILELYFVLYAIFLNDNDLKYFGICW